MAFDKRAKRDSADAGLIPHHELTLGELELVSGGKPAHSSPPPATYLKYELKDAVITSF